jgi:hypothetical protein
MAATIMAGTPAVIVMARVPVTVIAQMSVTDADRSGVTAPPGLERTWLQLSQGYRGCGRPVSIRCVRISLFPGEPGLRVTD